jgi:hypothetical protein
MLDISTDYLIFDNKETITFQNKDDSILTISNVIRRRSIMDIVENGHTITFAADMRFIIFKAEFGIAEELVAAPDGSMMHGTGINDYIRTSRFDGKPKINAIITDSYGKRYAVDRIFDDALRSRWVVDCTSLAGENQD